MVCRIAFTISLGPGPPAIVVERYNRRIVGESVVLDELELKLDIDDSPSPPSRFVDALAWNWIIGGTDAHAKNYSFLLAGDEVRLAPLNDIASALPYDMHEKKLRLAMKIDSDHRVHIYHDAWPELTTDLDLDGDQVIQRVGDLAARAPQAFAEAAATLEVEKLDRSIAHRLVDLVADRSARCLGILGVTRTSHRSHSD